MRLSDALFESKVSAAGPAGPIEITSNFDLANRVYAEPADARAFFVTNLSQKPKPKLDEVIWPVGDS